MAPMTRIEIFWGLYWDLLIFEKKSSSRVEKSRNRGPSCEDSQTRDGSMSANSISVVLKREPTDP